MKRGKQVPGGRNKALGMTTLFRGYWFQSRPTAFTRSVLVLLLGLRFQQ